MIKLFLFLIIFSRLFVSELYLPKNWINKTNWDKKASIHSNDDCLELKMSFKIIENELYTSKLRHIEIVTDENFFSEKSLTSIFKFISKKYSKPENLTIKVTTNQTKAELIVENRRGSNLGTARSGSSQIDENEFNYYQAIFYRRDRVGVSEYFKYTPKLKEGVFKTVIIKRRKI